MSEQNVKTLIFSPFDASISSEKLRLYRLHRLTKWNILVKFLHDPPTIMEAY